MFSTQSSYNINLGSHSRYASTLRQPEAISGTRKTTQFPPFRPRVNGTYLKIRAVTTDGDKIADIENKVEKTSLTSSSLKHENKDVIATITVSRKINENVFDMIGGQFDSFMNSIGRGMLIRVISEEIDPVTRTGKSVEGTIKSWSQPLDQTHNVEYSVNLTVPNDFGSPGAIIITNLLDKEIHLVKIILHGFNDEPIFFPANTWIHSQKDDPQSRIIFKNQAYLPSQTPAGINDLRHEDLVIIQGDGNGERKAHERVYDYDVYNDLGNSDKNEDLIRPILGGNVRPYPRRCRTGRPPTNKDPSFESTAETFYVPRDETFGELKEKTLFESTLRSIALNLIPLARDAISSPELAFNSFSDIDELYNDEDENSTNNSLLHTLLNPISDAQRLLKFDIPSGKKTYASRTILFYTDSGILQPIVIELSLPLEPSSARNKSVFTPENDAKTGWLWRLAKAHVCSHDASIHHFVSHWLRIHACSEPYIMATHRQLSSMHPIYKLLHPHMRYTLQVDATARQSLINAGGILETNYTADRYGLELSSDYYKNMWRFDLEGLPADLLQRGMAVEDASDPSGVKLVIEDYPYAADGLLIWSAIKEFVEFYVNHYYSDPTSIAADHELQQWWNEIKDKGHHDKRDEPWWPKLKTKEDLCSILTTMIWVVSGHHAAINFSQYPLGSYVPHRPTFLRTIIPRDGDPDYEKSLLNPEHIFLSSLPTQFQATQVMAMLETVSTHSADEEYLNQLHKLHRFSNNDQNVLKLVEKFTSKLEEIERTITLRNKDTSLKHRCGAGVVPYEQLLPSSGPGATGRGVPNSITN